MRNSLRIQSEQQTIDHDIFQVSINSKKLMSILKKLEDNHAKLITKIQNIDDYYKEGDNALNKKITHLESNIKNLIQNQVENINISIQTDLRKRQEKQIKELHQNQSKLNQLKYSIQTLNEKINKVNSSLNQQIQNSVRNYSMENFTLKRNIEKTQQSIEAQFEQIAEKFESYKAEIKNNKESIFELQVKLKKYTEIALRPEDFDRIAMPDRKFQQSFNAEKYAQFLEIQKQKQTSLTDPTKIQKRTSSKEKQRSRSRRAIKKSFFAKTSPTKKSRLFRQESFQLNKPTQNYMSTLQYASISAKVQSLQKAIKQKAQKNGSDQNTNTFKRGVKTSMMKTFSYTKQEFQKKFQNKDTDHEKLAYDEMDACEIVDKIFHKLELIQKSVQAKQSRLSKAIEQMKEKFLILSEKTDFMKQKISKVNSEITQIKIKLLAVDKKNVQSLDLDSISNIQNEMGRLIQSLEKFSRSKLDFEEYERDKVKIAQKIVVIQQNLVDRAQKAEVKKAINFLQDKIKEIILLIANEYNGEKTAAINKQPAKCLTCDKDILKLENITNSNGFRGITVSKSSRDLTQKYYTRLVKSKKQNRPSSKMRHNYTTVTQLTQIQD